MDRAEKREFVTGLNGVFSNTGSVVVAHYAGLTVANMNELRSKMRAAGGTVKVAKNRLAIIALQGTESEGMKDLFKGQTLIETHLRALKIAAFGLEVQPRPGDGVDYDGERWRLIGCTPIGPDGHAIFYNAAIQRA